MIKTVLFMTLLGVIFWLNHRFCQREPQGLHAGCIDEKIGPPWCSQAFEISAAFVLGNVHPIGEWNRAIK